MIKSMNYVMLFDADPKNIENLKDGHTRYKVSDLRLVVEDFLEGTVKITIKDFGDGGEDREAVVFYDDIKTAIENAYRATNKPRKNGSGE